MIRDRSWKKADYPNAKPSWQKHRDYKYLNVETDQIKRVLKMLDYEKLAVIGMEMSL